MAARIVGRGPLQSRKYIQLTIGSPDAAEHMHCLAFLETQRRQSLESVHVLGAKISHSDPYALSLGSALPKVLAGTRLTLYK